MHKLAMSVEGVFPIVKNALGENLHDSPNTGFSKAGTIQGEGKLAGVPSLFVRLNKCNLRCIWELADNKYSICDTAHSSFDIDKGYISNVDEVYNIIKHNIGSINHLVITGGEPLLQAKSLLELCKSVKRNLNLHITIETNGTIFIPELIEYVDLFSISPKLSNANPNANKLKSCNIEPNSATNKHSNIRLNLNVLRSFAQAAQNKQTEVQYKFVVAKPSDIEEIKLDILQTIPEISNKDIMLMSLGITESELNLSINTVMQACIENNWRYSPRLHINLFGNKMGV